PSAEGGLPGLLMPCRVADRFACDADAAFDDQGLQPRPRQLADALRQHAVEPLPRLLQRDGDTFNMPVGAHDTGSSCGNASSERGLAMISVGMTGHSRS